MDGKSESSQASRSGKRLILVAAIVAALVTSVVAVRRLAPGLPIIHEADLAAANLRWQTAGVADYRLTVVLGGRQTGEIKIEVRDGRPTGMTRNGTTVTPSRTWEPWTVPGMFETLETDFDNAAHKTEKFGGADVVMRAEFDATYGYPRRYLNQIFGPHGELSWEVTQFETLQ